MSWFLVIMLVILAWRVAEGFQKGMIKEIISFISLAVLCAAAVLVWNILTNYVEKDIIKIIVAVLLLLVLLIVHKLLGLVFFSAKVFSHLPVVHGIDRLLGAVLGVLETVLILWIICIFGSHFDVVGNFVLDGISEFRFLEILYDHNLLENLLGNVLKK